MSEEMLARVCREQGWTLRGSTAHIVMGDRHQDVRVERFEREGEELWRVDSVMGDASILDVARMRAALGLNYSLRHGAIAVHEDDLLVVDTVAVGPAEHDELITVIRYIAETADRYERLLFRRDSR